MRAVFAIAPLALTLAWLNPHTGARSDGLAGSPLSPVALSDGPAAGPASAASLPMVAYRYQADRLHDGAPKEHMPRPGAMSGSLLVNAAVVR